jgi:hypothetical protein
MRQGRLLLLLLLLNRHSRSSPTRSTGGYGVAVHTAGCSLYSNMVTGDDVVAA